METFRCRVSDSQGRIQSVVRMAPSIDVANREFSAEGLYVVSIEAVAPGTDRRLPRFRPSLVRDLADGLAALLSSGLSLSDSLEVMETVFETGAGARLVTFLRGRVERGDSLSSALGELSHSFPPVYRGLVSIGERIGSLAPVMTRLSEYLRKRKQIRDKFLGSLTYPAVVLLVAIAGVVVIGTVVLPRVHGMFEELGDSVPEATLGATRSLGAVSLGIGIALILLLAAAGAAALARRSQTAEAVDRFILRLPVAGDVVRRQEVLNFVFAMETLTESGVQIEAALAEAAGVLHNAALAGATRRIADLVTSGTALSAAFAVTGIYPHRLAVWARIGERTGNAASVFGQLRSYYEDEMNRWIDRFMSLVEPALILVVGAAMLVLVITFFVPLFGVFGSVL